MVMTPPELSFVLKGAAVVVRTTPLRYVGLALARAWTRRAKSRFERSLAATIDARGTAAVLRPVVAALAFAAACAATPLATAHAQSEPRPISLVEAVTMAQKNAPQIIQAQGQIKTSAASMRSAWASFLPNVSVSGGATRQLPAGQRTRIENGQVITLPEQPWSSAIGINANVELFDGGRRVFDIAEGRARNTTAKVNEVVQRFDVALNAKEQYFNVLAAHEAQSAAQAQMDQADQQRKVSVARAKARVATRSDSLRAENQVRSAQLAIMDARVALDVTNAGLTRAVGSPEPVTAAETDSLDPTLAIDEATLRHLAEEGPQVQLARADLDAARASQRGTWSTYLPTLNLSYSRNGSGVGNAPTLIDDEFAYNGSLRLALSFPIFNQLDRELQVTQAKVATRNAEADLRDARLASIETLTNALGAYRLAGERVQVQIATIEAAEEDVRVQQRRYSVGESVLLDVLASQTELNQARRDLIRARLDQRVAKARLEALVGRDL